MQLLAASGAFAPVDQHYLLAARQMQALSFAVHIPLPFNTLAANAAIATHGPGTVHLPLVIVGGRYCLQRLTFADVLACIEVLRGTQRKLPARCAALPGDAWSRACRQAGSGSPVEGVGRCQLTSLTEEHHGDD